MIHLTNVVSIKEVKKDAMEYYRLAIACEIEGPEAREMAIKHMKETFEIIWEV